MSKSIDELRTALVAWLRWHTPNPMEIERAPDACHTLLKAMASAPEGSGVNILADEVAAHQWIPVGKRLPKKTGWYLTVCNNDRDPAWVDIEFFNKIYKAFPMSVTHWKPLPLGVNDDG